MKRNFKSVIIAAVAAPVMLTSCLDEVQSTEYVTEGQLSSSTAAAEAILWSMPSSLNSYNVLGYSSSSVRSYDYGYPSMMHIRDIMTEDFAVTYSTYDWYGSWEYNTYLGEDYQTAQLTWWTLYKVVQAANNTIAAYKDNEEGKGELGMAQAYRAFIYLDLARMYEFLPNDKISSINASGQNVLNLTVPIVTDETTLEESRNNPRATREQMYEFILSDLDAAESNLVGYSVPSKAFPSLAVVYGLKARLYMWVENYSKAKEYARMAIAQSGATPLTRDEWLSTSSGFNDSSVSSWMWGGTQSKDDDAVQSWYYNWTSWSSSETTFGYCSYGPFNQMNKSMYERINDTDFRKLSWVAPSDGRLSGQEIYVDESFRGTFNPYVSLKFRPGSGVYNDANTGAVTDYPLMRVEEMYFIEAEAAAHLNASEGVSLLTDFMTQYRDSKYKCYVSSTDDVVEEIVFQKRVELWGEGQTFFDIKRLDYSVTRGYTGTNFQGDAILNTEGRPAWMNFVMVKSELTNNPAVMDYNNPDPSACYSPISVN